tara:strand:+ start:780 stop:920 length:141 start_codon:yes stop_codon:yes gene_type:complete
MAVNAFLFFESGLSRSHTICVKKPLFNNFNAPIFHLSIVIKGRWIN